VFLTENCAAKYAVSDVLYCVRLAIDGLEFLFIGAIPLCSSKYMYKGKGKVILLQARCGPEGG